MNEWRESSPGVFFGKARNLCPDGDTFAWLKARADEAPMKRARWCVHADAGDTLQEMLVAVRRDSFLPAHAHRDKPESIIALEGLAELVLYDELGNIVDKVALGAPGGARPFHRRIPANTFHTLSVETEYFLFHEITLGPWHKGDMILAPWEREKYA